MGESLSKELALANQLKQLCDDDGKETNPALSAEVLFNLGLLYKEKEADGINFIRSAALLNAALARQPSNAKYEICLKELCTTVLKVARAKKPETDLVEISSRVAKKIGVMRRDTEKGLKNLKIIDCGSEKQIQKQEETKVKLVKRLQSDIAAKYVAIMNYVSNKCIKIMGKAPCQYSVTGMGSLARKEITPYSDFEHIIVLEEGVQRRDDYSSMLEYFRWFSVIFQIIIINVKETIIPSLAIPLLNDHFLSKGDWFFDNQTTRGISFDGMMVHACKFPLGRMQHTEKKPWSTELIKPISEMTKYLELEEDLKNGYHLGDILTRTCFVSGFVNIHREFEKQVQTLIFSERFSAYKHLLMQLYDDLRNYSINESMLTVGDSATKCNIKRVVYRSSTLFISAIGRLHGIHKASCFEIIEELFARNLLTKESKRKLSYAIAVACEIRLKVYMSKHGQDDYVGERDFELFEKRTMNKLAELVGERSLAEYFVITFSVQNALLMNQSSYLRTLRCDLLTKFTILYLFNFKSMIFKEWDKYVTSLEKMSHEEEGLVKHWLGYTLLRNKEYTRAFEWYETLEKGGDVYPSLKAEIVRRKAFCLSEMKQYEAALSYIEEGTLIASKLQLYFGTRNHMFAYLTALRGDCHRHLENYKCAVKSYETCLGYLKYSSSQYKTNLEVKCLYYLAFCSFKLENIAYAIDCARKSLQLFSSTNVEISLLCDCYGLLAQCYLQHNQKESAMYFIQLEMKLRATYSPKENKDSNKIL